MNQIPLENNSIFSTVDLMISQGREIALRYFRANNLGLSNKLDEGFDPVTKADKEIELSFRKILNEHRPMDGILGEEFPNVEGSSGLTWVLDPIDGTRGFISGTPTWGMLIALNDGKNTIFGVVDQPFTQESYWGGLGLSEMRRNGAVQESKTRSCSDLSQAVLFSTFPEIGSAAEKQAFDRVSQGSKLTRYGMDCYAYALLASGQIDLVIEAGLNAYDIQAPIAVIEAAGGVITGWDGGTAQHGGRVVAAGDRRMHQKALEMLNSTG